MTRSTRKRRAFTLVEMLVSIAIVSVLLSLVVVGLARSRDAARRTICLSNARQIAVAINTFAAMNQNKLPENRFLVSDDSYVTWRWKLAENGSLETPEVWACPLHPDPGPRGEAGFEDGGVQCVGDRAASYALNGHIAWRYGLTDREAKLPDTVIRRPSHTILLAETNRFFANLRVSPPYVANYYGDSPGPYSYWHDGDGVYAFQDGHVEVIGFLDTGSPDCRWHNGSDLSEDPYVPQTRGELRPHDHPDWEYLVPEIYR